MPAPAELLQLMQRFEEQKEQYFNQAYNETQVRREFIDPLLELLGWDVTNKAGYAEQYKDVVHEDSIKVGGATKAPDYSCRIGGQRKFFVEAKKPAVSLFRNPDPAYQLRRYGWSAKLPLSILTNFAEFAVYDCRVKPEQSDESFQARIMYLTYDQLAEKWDELLSLFSPEAIRKGAFDRYAQDNKKKRGTAEVDSAFLEEISQWREQLAANIALRNKEAKLKSRDLSYAVQSTIDRLIFLRIAEDRGIEPYGRLLELTQGREIYPTLTRIFQTADAKYNSGLFHFKEEKGRSNESLDTFTLALKIDDKVLKEIIKRLYYPDSPYQFNMIPADILGQVYEQFLGKVIRLTPKGQAKIEDKPEVKKAGGVFYTPTYIVQYIVEQTVGRLLEGQTAGEKGTASQLKICDPSCGSGSFLIGAYQYLLDWHLSQYTAAPEEITKWRKGKNPPLMETESGGYRLTINERKRILLNNIYGVDIDQQAVEVTKLSLLLKVLEGETEQSLAGQMSFLHERVLPDLDQNVKCGNSLIAPDFYESYTPTSEDEEEAYRINVFDWHTAFPQVFAAGGFSAVIGNPPWGADIAKETNYLVKQYPSVPTKTKDSYLYFIEKILTLIKPSGFLGFLVPNTWLLINHAKEYRKKLLTLDVLEIIDYGDGVFKQATVESLSLIIRNEINTTGLCRAVRLSKGSKFIDHFVNKNLWLEDVYCRIILELNEEIHNLLKKLKANSELFENNCLIIWGIKPYQVGHGKPPQTREMVDKRIYHSEIQINEQWKPLLVGTNVNRYTLNFPGNSFIKYGEWLMYPSNEELILQPKILLRQTSSILRACYDANNYYCQNSLFIVHSSKHDLYYLLALLNSKVINFAYRFGNPQTGKVFAEIKPSVVKQLPIQIIDFSDSKEKQTHDDIVHLVKRILQLNEQLATAKTPQEKTVLQRQITAVDRQIDQLVYTLYGLTPEEIALVEA